MKADEKIILDKSKFRVEYPQDQILVKSPSMSDLVIIRQDGVTIGSIKSLSFVVADSIEIEVTVDLLKNVSEPSAVLASLLKSLIGRIAFYGARRPVSLSLTVSDFDNENHYEVLHSFDFVRIKGEKYFLKIVPEQIEPLSIIKKKLRDLQSTSVQIGRGFITDSSEYSELSIDLLMTEYNDLAWGRTSWAKHSNIAADELSVIGANCLKSDKVLEIGAGSGRLTFELAKKCGLLTASDYIPEIIDELSDKIKEFKVDNVKLVVDDIVSTNLPFGTFDKVFFLENGLGGILNKSKRSLTLHNIQKLLKPNGQLVLGVRSLGHESADHVMPASQDNTFFGIYHTFSEGEIKSYESQGLRLISLITGDVRPAGGHQLFAIFQKVSAE